MGLSRTSIANRLSPWALAAVAPVLMFVGSGRAVPQNYQTDLWHHLARGRAIVEQGQLLDVDIFTYTVPGEPFRDPNWLTQVVYYHLYRSGGVALLYLVNSLALAGMMALLVFACRRASGSLVVAAGLGMLAFFGLRQLLFVRPQTFSLLLFALVFVLLDLSERRRGWLLAVPALIALWANLHGAVPIGLYLIGAFFLGAAWEATFAEGKPPWQNRRSCDLALCLLGSVLATGINPYGYALYSYTIQTADLAAQRRINEWLPPPLGLATGQVWVASMLLAVGALGLPARRPRARDVLLVACFLPLPCMAVRMVPWWLLATLPVVAAQLGAWRGAAGEETGDAPRSSLIGAVALAMLAALVGLSLPGVDRWWRPLPRDGATEDDLAAIAERLREAPDQPRRLFARFEWGEYLGWALQPDGYRIFADARIEIYPDPVWSEYLAVLEGRADWQGILDKYGVSALVLQREPGLLCSMVERSGKWTRVCASGPAVLFLRGADPPENFGSRGSHGTCDANDQGRCRPADRKPAEP